MKIDYENYELHMNEQKKRSQKTGNFKINTDSIIIPETIKILPLETFVSNDKVFNFHTYLCVIDKEFIPTLSEEHIAYAWANIDYAPKPLHQGLRNSFSNKTIRTKLQTVFDLVDLI